MIMDIKVVETNAQESALQYIEELAESDQYSASSDSLQHENNGKLNEAGREKVQHTIEQPQPPQAIPGIIRGQPQQLHRLPPIVQRLIARNNMARLRFNRRRSEALIVDFTACLFFFTFALLLIRDVIGADWRYLQWIWDKLKTFWVIYISMLCAVLFIQSNDRE